MTQNSANINEHTLHVQKLFVQHQQAVLAYVLSLEPRRNEAEEIVQETFLTASGRATTWEAGTNFLAWACVIARYTTMGFQRDRGRRNRRLADDVIELLAEDWNDDFSVFQRRVSSLRTCLLKLAPKARQLVDLRYHAGKMPEQIAEEVGWSANAVRVALTRARTVLRECLQNQGESTL